MGDVIIYLPTERTAGTSRAAAYLVGEWLSLVEHLVRDQGVGGSNPLSPTNVFFPSSRSFRGRKSPDTISIVPTLRKREAWGSLC